MNSVETIAPNIFRGGLNLQKGALGSLLEHFDPQLIIGHPTLKNHETIGRQLSNGLVGAARVFAGERVAFLVADGTLNDTVNDERTLTAALEAAVKTMDAFPESVRRNFFIFAGPYGGYAGNSIQGKGSALKMLFDEAGFANPRAVILLDGDLQNDMAAWQAVFKKTLDLHARERPGEECFITARYARHFVDASITRFVVGPLTTLLGAYVPGGISGDIVLSGGAVALERRAAWNESRYRYGTDISTTLDNIAAGTVLYEAYLGAKLHDVTDDAKLSVMPGEVIAAGLERLLYYEGLDGRITRGLKSDEPLRRATALGPNFTNISFINPGRTGVFNFKAKQRALIDRFAEFEKNLSLTLDSPSMDALRRDHAALMLLENEPLPRFLNMNRPRYIGLMYQVVGYALKTSDLENAKRTLNYLYTAAFLEFCIEKLGALGFRTVADIEHVQDDLGVEDGQAERFYTSEVDRVAEGLAMDFYKGRKKILGFL